jgi:hypothetical protein
MGTQQTQKPQTKDQQDPRYQQDPQHQGTTQVGTHGNDDAWRQNQDQTDPAQREMRQGDRTDPAMPEGTKPLERDQRPINQQR